MNVGVAARPSPPDTMHPSDHFAPSHLFADPSVCLATRLSPQDCFSASLSSSPSSRCGSEALKAAVCRPAGGLQERPSLLGAQGLEQEWAAIFGEDDGEDGINGGYGDDVDYGYPGNVGNNGGEREEEDDEEDVPWEVISSRLRQQLKQVLHQQKQQHVQLSHARTHDGYHSQRHPQAFGHAPPQLNASTQKDPIRGRLESCQQWEQSIDNDQGSRRTASYRDGGCRESARENSSREGSSREEINWLAQACEEGRSKQVDRRTASSRRSFDVARSARNPVSETVSVSVTGGVFVSGFASRDCSAHSSPVPLQQRRRSHSEVPPLLVTVPRSSLERSALSGKKGSPALPPSLRQGASSSPSPSDRQQKAFPPRSPRSNLSAQALRTSSLSPDSPSVSPCSSSAALSAALAASRKAESFREDLDSSDEEFLAAYCHITGSPTPPDCSPAAGSPVTSPPSAGSAVVRALQKSASCLEGRGEQRQAPVRAQAGRAQALAKSQETLLRKGGASGGASGARDAHARIRAQEVADVPQRSYTAPSGGSKPAPFAAPFAAVIAHQNLEQQKLHLKKQLQQAQQLRTAIGGGFSGSSGGSSSGCSGSGLSASELARGLEHEFGGKQAGRAGTAHGPRGTGGNGGASSAGPQAQPPNAAQSRSRGIGGHADTPAGGVVSAGAQKLFGLGSQSHRILPHAATTGGGPRSLVRGRSWASLEFQRAQGPPQHAPHLEELATCTKGLPTIESSGSGSGSGSGHGGSNCRSREKGNGGSRTVSFSERHSALVSPADSPRARAGVAAPPLSAMGRAISAAAGGASRCSPSFTHERSALPELPGLAKRALLAQAQEGTGSTGAGGTLAGAGAGAPGLSRTSSARQLYVRKMLLDLAAQSDEASEAGSGSGSGHASPCFASGGGSGTAGSGTGGSGKGGRSVLSRRGVLGRSASGKEHAGRRAGATAHEGAEAAQVQLRAVRRSASARYQPASRLSVDLSAAASAGLTGGENGGGAGGCGEGKSLGRSASDKAMGGGYQARMVGLPSISGAISGISGISGAISGASTSGAISGPAAAAGGGASAVLVDPFAGAYNGGACDEDEDDADLFDILAAMRSMQTSPHSPSPLSPLNACPPRSPVPLSPSPANSPHTPPLHHPYSRDPSPAPRAPLVPRPSSPPPPPLLRSPSPDSRSPSPRSRNTPQPNHPSSLSLSHPNITPGRPASQLYSSAPGPYYESPPRSPPLSPLGSSPASSPRSPPLTPPRGNRRRSLHIPSRSMPSALARPNRRHSVSEDRPLNMTHPAARQPGSSSGGSSGGGGGGPFAAGSFRGASAAAARAFAQSRSLNSSSSAAAAAAAAVKAAARRGQVCTGEGKLNGGGGAKVGKSGSCTGGGDGSGGGDMGDRVFNRARTQPTERASAGRGR